MGINLNRWCPQSAKKNSRSIVFVKKETLFSLSHIILHQDAFSTKYVSQIRKAGLNIVVNIGHHIRGCTPIPPQLQVLTKEWEQALYIKMKLIFNGYLLTSFFFLKHYFLSNYLHINKDEM